MTGPAVLETRAELVETLTELRAQGRSVGFVPTMGALHEGHRSLIRQAVAHGDVVIVSIFVNPLQFGVGEDLDRYPRPWSADLAVCTEESVDLIFAPSPTEMYPTEMATTVAVAPLNGVFDGASRPGHFDGVTTVVAKLLSLVGPCRAYFGEKDWQQLVIVKQMVTDLSLPVTVVGCPTIRESDGLALSSRNAYLTDDQRPQAVVLRRALDAGLACIADGERDRLTVEARMAEVVAATPEAHLEYAAAVSADRLTLTSTLGGPIRLLIAVRFGTTRLIDNDGVVLDRR